MTAADERLGPPSSGLPDGEELAAAIRTRRRLKCFAQGSHTDEGNCARCGL